MLNFHHLQDFSRNVHDYDFQNWPRLTAYMPIKWPYSFLFDGKSNACPACHHLQHMCKSNQMTKVWPGNIRSWLRRETHLHDHTANVLFYIVDIFYFSYLATHIYEKGVADTYAHTHTCTCNVIEMCHSYLFIILFII